VEPRLSLGQAIAVIVTFEIASGVDQRKSVSSVFISGRFVFFTP
jgi:hypothetical protein